ncbi:hypothetical protein [Halorubrum trueperi]|uniref:Uncharacterized protein n=1 Tax=Halorubrum trueperi TaxID=2004704 RepID=A0ABD5UN14_9EURY
MRLRDVNQWIVVPGVELGDDPIEHRRLVHAIESIRESKNVGDVPAAVVASAESTTSAIRQALSVGGSLSLGA